MNNAGGCLSGCLIIVILLALIGGCVSMFGEDDYEDDDDINYDYIEQDYNGDGEKDAEDYRIQTEDGF